MFLERKNFIFVFKGYSSTLKNMDHRLLKTLTRGRLSVFCLLRVSSFVQS
jgi:hypothetical protein